MSTTDRLFDEIRALPKAERLRLAERVIRSVADETGDGAEGSLKGASVVGLFSDEPDRIDEIVEDAIRPASVIRCRRMRRRPPGRIACAVTA